MQVDFIYVIWQTNLSKSFGDPTLLHNFSSILFLAADTPDAERPTRFAIDEEGIPILTNRQI